MMRFRSATACLSLLAVAYAASAAVNVIPCPKEVSERGGSYAAPADFFEHAAERWTKDATLPAEGYRLEVSPSGVAIAAADAAGAFYAVQTLRQLAPTNTQGLTLRQVADVRRLVCRDSVENEGLSAEGKAVLRTVRGTYEATWPIPCVTIRDWPDYRWRAFMLDEGRHFFGKSAVLDLLDRMAEYKLNVFHWHLTEDQGWRLDIPGFPELVKYGAVRPCSVSYRTAPSYVNGFDKEDEFYFNDEPYGPYYYTAKDVADVLAYAKARHIRVMPEIEFPGHARALLAAHPEFSCVGEKLPRTPRTGWGIEKEVVCGGNLAFYSYMEKVLDAVCDLFPESDIIHIGGDECFCERWKECPKCQALIKKEGLRNERALQSRMTTHFANYLNAKGRKIMGWDGLLTGEPLDVTKTLVHYRMPRPGARAKTAGEAAALGHDVAVIRTINTYFNYSQGLDEDPHYYRPWSGNVRLSDVYACDPAEGVAEKDLPHMMGAEGLLWSEYVTDRGDMEWKVWPRSCAMAETLWSGRAKPGFDDFRRRMGVQRRRLLREGLNCAPVE